jgi:hypothetical protein
VEKPRRRSARQGRQKQTEPTQIKGHKVAATKADPQFIVETDDGKRAAHKPSALKKG